MGLQMLRGDGSVSRVPFSAVARTFTSRLYENWRPDDDQISASEADLRDLRLYLNNQWELQALRFTAGQGTCTYRARRLRLTATSINEENPGGPFDARCPGFGGRRHRS